VRLVTTEVMEVAGDSFAAGRLGIGSVYYQDNEWLKGCSIRARCEHLGGTLLEMGCACYLTLII
jgi:hypothetical protein